MKEIEQITHSRCGTCSSRNKMWFQEKYPPYGTSLKIPKGDQRTAKQCKNFPDCFIQKVNKEKKFKEHRGSLYSKVIQL